MHRRYQHLNIPIEIVRTVVAIAETGSLSKAGERLGLSQPAVSSQVKRLQNLIGGAFFELLGADQKNRPTLAFSGCYNFLILS